MVNIEDIDELIGPVMGPFMLALVHGMRENYDYQGGLAPSLFAVVVRSKCGELSGKAPSTEQCPELFASEALGLLVYAPPAGDVTVASKEFQARLRFHMAR